MIVSIKPSRACGVLCAPPSKSAAHRALICAALSGGAEVKNIEYSEDISATLDCVEALGATVERHENSAFVGGLSPQNIKECTLNCRESGSTLRFLIPLCMLSGKRINLTGAPRLFERNLKIYEDLAEKNNIFFGKTDNGSQRILFVWYHKYLKASSIANCRRLFSKRFALWSTK